MTPELIGILAVGVALAGFLGGLSVALFQATNRRIGELEHRVDQRFNTLEQRLNSLDQRLNSFDQRLNSFEERLSALEQRQARVEGLMEAIRDILGRLPLAQQ